MNHRWTISYQHAEIKKVLTRFNFHYHLNELLSEQRVGPCITESFTWYTVLRLLWRMEKRAVIFHGFIFFIILLFLFCILLVYTVQLVCSILHSIFTVFVSQGFSRPGSSILEVSKIVQYWGPLPQDIWQAVFDGSYIYL